MRVMAIVKATAQSESGVLPNEEELTDMGRFNEELVRAGVMLAGEGLAASSQGVRVSFGGGKSTVMDGPFTETKELIAGYWLWQVHSLAEAGNGSAAHPLGRARRKSRSAACSRRKTLARI